MSSLFRRTFLFAAGALTATAALVRVRSNVVPVPSHSEMYFAILAEGVQWEVRVDGGGMGGTWHVDVPSSCRDLPPRDRMVVVDKIMRRIAENARQRPVVRPALPSYSRRLLERKTA